MQRPRSAQLIVCTSADELPNALSPRNQKATQKGVGVGLWFAGVARWLSLHGVSCFFAVRTAAAAASAAVQLMRVLGLGGIRSFVA